MRHLIKHGAKVLKFFSLILLIGITFSYAMFQGGFVSWFLFYSFLPFALYALYLTFVPLQSFSVERSLSQSEFFAHDDLTVTIRIKRTHSLPLLFIIVEDCLNVAIEKNVKDKQNKRMIFLYFKKEYSFQYDIYHLPRGEHEFSEVRLLISDLLGMVEKEKVIKKREKILVYPSYQKFVHLPVSKFLEQSRLLSGGHHQQETASVVGIRDYQRGDRFAWIHWKASAKRAGMVTKEFEHRTSTDVVIVLDGTPSESFERMVSFTAALGQILLIQGTSIGFFTNNEKSVTMPIHGGEASRRQLFYHLATIQANASRPFHKMLTEGRLLRGKQATLVLITSHISKQLIEAAGRLAVRKRPVMLFVLQSKADSSPSFKEVAKTYGVLVVFIHEDPYSTGLMEVN